MARKHRYEIDVDQELIAQGFACGAAGFVGGFATDGSLSKTSVADAAGQRTQVASLINAVLILLTMLVLAGLFEQLPGATLAAVVVDAMLGLITFAEWRRYYTVNRPDWLFFMGAGLGILFFGIIQGILIGVVLSLLLLIWRSSRTSIRELRRDPAQGTFHVASRHGELAEVPGLLVVRVDGPLFFADADRFRARIRELIARAPRDAPGRDRRRRDPPDRHRRRRHHRRGRRGAGRAGRRRWPSSRCTRRCSRCGSARASSTSSTAPTSTRRWPPRSPASTSSDRDDDRAPCRAAVSGRWSHDAEPPSPRRRLGADRPRVGDRARLDPHHVGRPPGAGRRLVAQGERRPDRGPGGARRPLRLPRRSALHERGRRRRAGRAPAAEPQARRGADRRRAAPARDGRGRPAARGAADPAAVHQRQLARAGEARQRARGQDRRGDHDGGRDRHARPPRAAAVARHHAGPAGHAGSSSSRPTRGRSP